MESLTGQRKAARWRQEISRCGVDTGVAAPWTCTEMGLAVFTGARGSRFVCDEDGGFGELVATISQRADAPINSCAREAAAEPFLRELGKMSQQQLFDCFQDKRRLGKCPDRCHGNCNRANQPGKSTHERRNDGVAYPLWLPFLKLPVWARGIDVQRDRVEAFREEARRAGFLVTLTYPGSQNESQHVNFRKEPKFNIWKLRPLRPGMQGPRGSLVVRLLWALVDPQTRKPYLDRSVRPHGKITPPVVRAINAFQHDHHIPVTGVVGVETIRALRAARRLQKKQKKEAPTP